MRSSILVIEDDTGVCQSLVQALADKGGFMVSAAGSISGARKVMAECAEHFSLVVVDMKLPDGNGWDFCASLRCRECHIPVILLTGPVHEPAHKNDVARGLRAGANDYLAEPFNTNELLARVTVQLRHLGPKPSHLEPALARDVLRADQASASIHQNVRLGPESLMVQRRLRQFGNPCTVTAMSMFRR